MNASHLPPLPSLRALTAELRALHEAYAHPCAGGEYACLGCECLGLSAPYWRWRALAAGQVDAMWIAHLLDGPACIYGWEWIPGDGARFDAVGAARRLLAAARDGGVK